MTEKFEKLIDYIKQSEIYQFFYLDIFESTLKIVYLHKCTVDVDIISDVTRKPKHFFPLPVKKKRNINFKKNMEKKLCDKN